MTILAIHYAPETTGNAPYTNASAEELVSAAASARVITGVPDYPQWNCARENTELALGGWRAGTASTLSDFATSFQLTLTLSVARRLVWGSSHKVRFLPSTTRSDLLIAVTPTLSGLATALLTRRGRSVGVLVQDLTGAAARESDTSSANAGGLISKVEYWLLRRADLVRVITLRFAAVLAANGANDGKLVNLANFSHVCPLGSTPEEAGCRLGWEPVFSIVHTANMGMKQGLETVVAAAWLALAQQPAIRFVLVGEGNQRDGLERIASGCENIRFVSPLEEDDYPYALAAADILLLNERQDAREMSFPSRLTSYAAAGRPIVAAVEYDGITGEILERRGAALRCKAGDPQALLNAVKRIRASTGLAYRLTMAAAKLHAEECSAKAALVRYRGFALALSSLDRSQDCQAAGI